jgi:signal transduction histidine kinase
MKNQKSTEIKKRNGWSLEKKAMIALSVIFVCVLGVAWVYAMNLKKTIAASNAVVSVDVRALVDVEKMRNLGQSQIDNSLSFFLLGSTTLMDEQKEAKQALSEALENFPKQYNLPQAADIIKRVQNLQAQQQEIFDQAMEFRAKQTESKIVGQFYRSKTKPIQEQLNKAFDEIVALHNAELDRDRNRAQTAALSAESQIPEGMTWFTGVTAALFAGMALLVMRMLGVRSRNLAERDRLYQETQKALQTRDELMAAIASDLKTPLGEITEIAEDMKGAIEPAQISDGIEMIQSSVGIIDAHLKDILDEAKAATGHMILRLDQLGIDTVLDDARRMLQPVAKQNDIRLEFNSVNPPVLAFMDRERVMRVLANLVGNAIKFSPKNSKVIVKVRSDQQFVYVSVKDSGPGIPEKQIPEIFNHFWQARSTADQGAGVGLAIVKTIVEAHGGTVSADSHGGNGSTFTFSLPRRRPAGAHLGKTVASTVRLKKSKTDAEASEGTTH